MGNNGKAMETNHICPVCGGFNNGDLQTTNLLQTCFFFGGSGAATFPAQANDKRGIAFWLIQSNNPRIHGVVQDLHVFRTVYRGYFIGFRGQDS